MGEALARCPFCNGDADRRTWVPYPRTAVIRHAVACGDCGARTGWLNTAPEAISAWNRRASETDFVFSCPHCGSPAASVEGDVDIHPGATYECDQCGGDVVFEALTGDEYMARYGRAVCDMRLCESTRLLLLPDVLYRFTVDPECYACRQQAIIVDVLLAPDAAGEGRDDG